ncbi:unnamed protein product [Trichobilharzia regenti]|nr:unnamed protein product [Trichobilharzia regenti]
MGISLVGDPSLVIMDEPSCGVDPRSRRSLWYDKLNCSNVSLVPSFSYRYFYCLVIGKIYRNSSFCSFLPIILTNDWP